MTLLDSDSEVPLPMRSAQSEQELSGSSVEAQEREKNFRNSFLWSACAVAALAMIISPYRTRRELRKLQDAVRTGPSPSAPSWLSCIRSNIARRRQEWWPSS